MSNNQKNVGATLQNAQEEIQEVKVPNFLSPFTIKRSEQRTINLGNYENVKVDAGIEVQVEISTQEDYILAVDYLDTWLKQDLDTQEKMARAMKEAKVQAEKQVQIKQAEEYAEKMKSVPLFVWQIQTNVGTLAVSNDPNFELRCPRCGKPMQFRKGVPGKYEDFYGCTGYRDEVNKCTFGVNKSMLDEFFATANELIAAGAPNVAGLTATIIKAGNDKYISINKDACYQEENPQPQVHQAPQQNTQVHQAPPNMPYGAQMMSPPVQYVEDTLPF
jgi:ssDNA-binding Zn-finger/Zn-ribbon topoisomerase 1